MNYENKRYLRLKAIIVDFKMATTETNNLIIKFRINGWITWSLTVKPSSQMGNFLSHIIFVILFESLSLTQAIMHNW